MSGQPFSGWIASLSDGSTVFETSMEPGKPSPWQALLARLKAEGLRITMLRLQLLGVTLICMPKADGYLQCTEVTKSVITGQEQVRRGLGSVFGDQVVMIWIDENRNVWQDVRPLKELRIHSTLA